MKKDEEEEATIHKERKPEGKGGETQQGNGTAYREWSQEHVISQLYNEIFK